MFHRGGARRWKHVWERAVWWYHLHEGSELVLLVLLSSSSSSSSSSLRSCSCCWVSLMNCPLSAVEFAWLGWFGMRYNFAQLLQRIAGQWRKGDCRGIGASGFATAIRPWCRSDSCITHGSDNAGLRFGRCQGANAAGVSGVGSDCRLRKRICGRQHRLPFSAGIQQSITC